MGPAYLQDAVKGVEGQPSKGGQGVLLVVLVMNVVQHPAAQPGLSSPFHPALPVADVKLVRLAEPALRLEAVSVDAFRLFKDRECYVQDMHSQQVMGRDVQS